MGYAVCVAPEVVPPAGPVDAAVPESVAVGVVVGSPVAAVGDWHAADDPGPGAAPLGPPFEP